jgi:uncharacterized protein (DUF4415 family)
MIRKEAKLASSRAVDAKLAWVGHPEGLVTRVRKGRPSSGKQVVSMRLEPEVLAKFKATGAGWQARINEALKAAKV